jgi:hypothetical protein
MSTASACPEAVLANRRMTRSNVGFAVILTHMKGLAMI